MATEHVAYTSAMSEILLPLFALMSGVSLALVTIVSGQRDLAWKLFATFGLLLSAPPLCMLTARLLPAPYHLYVARLAPVFALATFAAAMLYIVVIGRLNLSGRLLGVSYLFDFTQDPPRTQLLNRSITFNRYLLSVFGFWALVGLLLTTTDWAIADIRFAAGGPPQIEFGPAVVVLLALMVISTVKIIVFLNKAHRETADPTLRSFLRFNMAAFVVLFVPAVTLNVMAPALGIAKVPLGLISVPIAAFVFLAGIVRYQFSHIRDLNHNLEDKVKERTRELEQAQLRLVQSEKLASMAQLTAGLAHELNNPVGAIRSMVDNAHKATDRLRADAAPSAERSLTVLESAHRVIGEGATRVSDLVGRLRDFAHLDEAEIQTVSLQRSIEEVLSMMSADLRNANVRLELAELPPLLCRPHQLNHLWLNLLSNARNAIAPGGTIVVRSGQSSEGQWAEVTDDGCGIDPELLERIFDPDFRPKGERVRAGFGLAICYQIVAEHEGSIHIESQPKRGTTVKVRLPAAPASLTPPSAAQ